METFQRLERFAIAIILVSGVWAACRQPRSEVKIENAADRFSSSYGEARQKFLSAAVAAGAEIESLKNPATGLEG